MARPTTFQDSKHFLWPLFGWTCKLNSMDIGTVPSAVSEKDLKERWEICADNFVPDKQRRAYKKKQSTRHEYG